MRRFVGLSAAMILALRRRLIVITLFWVALTSAAMAADNQPGDVVLSPLEVTGEGEPFVPAPSTMEAIKNYVEGTHYWFDPAVFPGRAPVDHPRGPRKARGLMIWTGSHIETQGAYLKVPPIAQYFAEQGWDIYNLMRHSILANSEGTNMRPWLPPRRDNQVVRLILAIAERARAMGYNRVILMGDGRGGYEAVHAGRYKASVEGILSLAPAIYDEDNSHFFWRRNHFRLASLWKYYSGPSIKVAAVFFEGDHLHEATWPNIRGPHASETLTAQQVPNFIISQPPYADMHGYQAGLSWAFARRYGPCLLLFYETGRAPPCSDRDPATAETFGIRPSAAPSTEGVYGGLWQGTWSSGHFVAMAVRHVDGDALEITYMPGLGIEGEGTEPQQWRVLLGGPPVVDTAGTQYAFRAGPNDTLLGERLAGAAEAGRGQIVMYRMP